MYSQWSFEKFKQVTAYAVSIGTNKFWEEAVDWAAAEMVWRRQL